MQRDSVNGEPVNEKFLFHGTSRNTVEAICANNFDWRVCGSHGTVYGQGDFTVALTTWMVQWLRHWTSDDKGVRLLAVSLSCNDPGQVVRTRVPLSPSSIIWYWLSPNLHLASSEQ